MKELDNPRVNQLEAEILAFSKELRQNILKIGRLQLGEKATIREICNHIGPQFGLSPKQCLDIMMHVKEGIK